MGFLQNTTDLTPHFMKLNVFIVIKNDSILFEEYWDEYSSDSLSNSFSIKNIINK